MKRFIVRLISPCLALPHALALFVIAVLALPGCQPSTPPTNDFATWQIAGGNADGNKYSSLAQIDTSNVQQLRVAWIYHTRDLDTAAHSQIQCNPIIVNGTLYATSPQLKLVALDAATGQLKWSYSPYDSITEDMKAHFNLNNNRGVTYWTDHQGDERIFYTAGPYLQAIDAKTGRLIDSFGTKGKIDLHDGLGEEAAKLFVTATSPASIYKDILIAGTRVSEAMDAAPGHIRGFDVRTGKMKWIFHTIPQPGEPGYETWQDANAWKHTGGANNWMGLTIDRQRGIAYVPIGSASMDFYGGKRIGADLYADCLLALDATTGKLLWHFQYIHHDTWDWDPSSAPVLLTVTHQGQKIDAVAQTTKTGFVFLFNRETGKPLFPIVETPVDTVSELAGERLWPTQPIPQMPRPFVRQSFTEKDINPYLSPEEFAEVKQRLLGYHGGKMFTPQSKEGTVIFPGFDGGGEWGGPAVDPSTGLLYVNANQMAWILHILDIKDKATHKETLGTAGSRLFMQNCMSCHGANRKGGGNYPSLLDVNKKYDKRQFIDFINAGRRMMPAFQHLKQQEKEAIASFVLNEKKEQAQPYIEQLSASDSFRMAPYNISGYHKFLSKSGLPAIAPPWGTLNAIDLNCGDLKWTLPLGEEADLKAKGIPPTGTENYGGPVVTAGGLLFIAATKDGMFRAFNKRDGKLLWETKLPAPGFATPATYEVNGKQYVVIACGGGKLNTESGDVYIAFALPPTPQPAPVSVIFDTDIGPDYDDVGAITLLHAFADSGRARILATMASNKYEGIAAILNLFNTYFHRPDVPIGVPRGPAVDQRDFQHWTDSLLAKYPHTIHHNSEVPDAVELYRKILARQPDHSVVIITVGFLTNLSNLLQSGPDKYADLNGEELVRRKVSQLVSMAGAFPKGKEFNVHRDADASRYVTSHWPAPVIYSGFEIGKKIKCGLPIIANEAIQNSPVKDVFRICIPLAAEDSAGRSSWDETAVLVGVTGYQPYYTIHQGRMQVDTDGSNTWIEGATETNPAAQTTPATGTNPAAQTNPATQASPATQAYLVEARPFAEVQDLINTLIMHQPSAK
ncbi:MAG TPA: PQQ-binding-like beta-propeller repeat protein [Puia sp.]|nr:PQQ-binding-like beta-propeller repeat protein [Puia sp.]